MVDAADRNLTLNSHPPHRPAVMFREIVGPLRSWITRIQDIRTGTIKTWTFPLTAGEQELAWLRDLLDDHERMRTDRFLFEEHRRRFVVAHGVLRCVMGQLLGRSPEQIVWQYAALGKPSVGVRQNPLGLQFNLSHSGEVGFLAVTRSNPVGADVEAVRRLSDAHALAECHFSADEVGRLSRDALPREFFRFWTRKEALLKATGKGLSGGLRNFCTAGQLGNSHGQVLVCNKRLKLTDTWCYFDCPAPPDYFAAVVSNFVPDRIVSYAVRWA